MDQKYNTIIGNTFQIPKSNVEYNKISNKIQSAEIKEIEIEDRKDDPRPKADEERIKMLQPHFLFFFS